MDKSWEVYAYGNLGDAFQSLGDSKKAIEYHSCCLNIANELGDKAAQGRAYGRLGKAFQSLSDFLQAIEYYTLRLTIVKEMRNKAGEGGTYNNLGKAFESLFDFKKAIHYYILYLKIAQELKDRAAEGDAYSNLGTCFERLGDFRKAEDYHYLSLDIFKEMEDKSGEGAAYGNLGVVFHNLGNFKKAVDYHGLRINIAKEMGDKAEEGVSYGNLGNAFHSLGDYKKAIEYHMLDLKIANEQENKAEVGRAYGNLGIAFYRIGDFKRAIDYHNLRLRIAKEVTDKVGEGSAYANLGNAFQKLRNFEKAIHYHDLYLKIAKEVKDIPGQGRAYGNLGNDFQCLGDVQKAIDYHNQHLNIAKEVGDKAGEGTAYGNLGNAFQSLGDFKKALDYQNCRVSICKEINDKVGEGAGYYALGYSFESLGRLSEAVKCYKSGVRLLNDVRSLLEAKDEWKIGFRNECQIAFIALWRVLLKQGEIVEALFAAEQGRAQALNDLMESQFFTGSCQSMSRQEKDWDFNVPICIPSSTVFQAVEKADINSWIVLKGGNVSFRRKELENPFALDNSTKYSLIRIAYQEIGIRSCVNCENRTLIEDKTTDERFDDKSCHSSKLHSLRTLYNVVIKPISNLVQSDKLIIVPDGPLWLAPYAAFVDNDSKYLCESFQIRLIPSLTSLKMITDCPDEYHCKSGALLVGDPCVEEVTDNRGRKLLQQLKFAKKEVEMIGVILGVTPVTGKEATKAEVLRRLSSVALVHIAAHGRMETGEIALCPEPERASLIPTKEDYILTMADVMSVQLRARLVVLSCCHSARGEIKAEGVVGIARAFMGAGARSVLVSLWAIDDEATLEFMRSFYHHLVEGKSASEALKQAMKYLRESDKYSDVKYWAPFVLIGDDIKLEFGEEK